MRKTNLLTAAGMLYALAALGVNPSAEDRARCFMDNAEERTVTFIFDNNLWKASGIQKLQVFGSFTLWKASDEFTMTYDSEGNFWHVTVPYEDVKIPGNSGQPEFKFVSNGSNYLSGGSKSFIPEGYIFLNGDKNNIVVFHDDDFETIKENSRTANVLKKVTDFDLTTREGQEAISNFRRVPGTSALFRCYHPYKLTKTTNATEPVRMEYLTRLAEEEGIKSDICLSENEERNLQSFTISGQKYTEQIPAYYQRIIDNKSVLYVGATNSVPTYNVVYYTPESDKFGTWVREVVEFIIDDAHETPFSIHCRIGTDRTGAFSGLLAALCGASWEEIAADYQLTNRMGIQEFRDYHLLQYGFQRLLGVSDIHEVPDLQKAMSEYFVGKGYVTDDQLSRLREKLTSATSADALPTASATLRYDAASKLLYGSTELPIAVYSIDGAQVLSSVGKEDISLDGLAPGLYIASAGNYTLRVIVK